MYYGQCGEDKHIHEKYFYGKRGGVFLEMGAMDGIKYSNTKFFEDSLGWSGVLIEPIPHLATACKQNRPRSKVFQCAVSQSQTELDMYSHAAVSSVVGVTTPEYYNTWHKDKNIPVIRVSSRRLDDILHEAGVTHIDFWSLDVEGSEYEVLQTMDWSIPVDLLCIEMLGGSHAELNGKCRLLLRERGYRMIETFAHNEIWRPAKYLAYIPRASR
jgi:FkbM family methyltransferase